MTNRKINRAIAVLRGWRFVEDDPDYEPYWEDPAGNMIGEKNTVSFPNYAGCLNAMYEAEKMLFPKFEIEWYSQLQNVCGNSWRIMIHSTARQRAEAFLRTLGKWEDEA
jgi:hypothetical protein